MFPQTRQGQPADRRGRSGRPDRRRPVRAACGWAWPGAAKDRGDPCRKPDLGSLGQNAAQAAQYEALGYIPESAHDLILARFDYSFSPAALITMIVVIVPTTS
jgi:hypothetical protein